MNKPDLAYFRSNSYPFFQAQTLTSFQSLFSWNHPGTVCVLESLTLGHASGASGDWAFLSSSINSAYLLSGNIGAGNADTFTWSGVFALRNGDQIYFDGQGEWNASGTGHVEPDLVTLMGWT